MKKFNKEAGGTSWFCQESSIWGEGFFDEKRFMKWRETAFNMKDFIKISKIFKGFKKLIGEFYLDLI